MDLTQGVVSNVYRCKWSSSMKVVNFIKFFVSRQISKFDRPDFSSICNGNLQSACNALWCTCTGLRTLSVSWLRKNVAPPMINDLHWKNCSNDQYKINRYCAPALCCARALSMPRPRFDRFHLFHPTLLTAATCSVTWALNRSLQWPSLIWDNFAKRGIFLHAPAYVKRVTNRNHCIDVASTYCKYIRTTCTKYKISRVLIMRLMIMWFIDF